MSSRRSIRILGVAFLAAFSFCAVSVASAQAAPHWFVGGAEFGGEETISSSGGPFELSVPKQGNLLITCQKQTATGKIFGGNKDEATVEFTECSVKNAGVCTVLEPIVAATNTELIEAGGVVYDKFTPVGERFTTITLEGAECSAFGSFPVKGTVAGQVGPEAVESTLTFSKAISEASVTQLNFGANPAFLTGSAKQKLTGANAGKTLGAK